MNNNLLIFLLLLIFQVLIVLAKSDTNITSTSTYLRSLANNNNGKLCTCDKVECGLCMTGCSPSTSDDCKTGRNWCYCNIMGTNCLEVIIIVIVIIIIIIKIKIIRINMKFVG